MYSQHIDDTINTNRILSGRYLLIISLIIIFTLIGLFSLKISTEADQLSSSINEFYEHPYQVRTTIRDFHLTGLEIVLEWKSQIQKNNFDEGTEESIRGKFQKLDDNILLINEKYLGPKTETLALTKSYTELKNYIYPNGKVATKVDDQQKAQIETQLFIDEIVADLQPIELFAIGKAEEFMSQSVVEKGHLLDRLMQLYIGASIIFIVGTFVVGFLMTKKDLNIFSEKEKFKKSILFAPIPIMIHKNGVVLQLSKEWMKLSGYTKNEIPTIEEWSRKAYGESYIPSKEYIMGLYKLKETQSDGDWTIKTKSGEERIWRFHTGPLGNNTVVSTALDVTNEIRNQEKIELFYKETLKLAKAVEQSPVSIIITDVKGNIEYVNEYFTKLTGYSFEEVIGQNPRILKSGLQDPDFYKNLWETISNGQNWYGDLQNKAKDGSIYWESASISPIFDDDKKITSYVAVKENITDRIRIEKQLIETNRKLINAQKTGNIGNWVYDLASEKIEWSDQLFEIYNRDIELGPPTFKEFQSYHMEKEDSFCRLLEALEHGVAYDEDITLITKQGQKKFIRTVGIPEFDTEGKVQRFTGVAQNITYSKNIELDIIESERRLKRITDNIEGLVQRYVQYEDGSDAITYISKGVERLHGISQKEVITDSSLLWKQIIEEDYDRVAKSIQKSAKKLTPWDCKWRIKTPDGSEKWLHGKGFPIKDEENKCIIWDSIVVDVTKEVVSELSLRETNIRLNAAQDIARIGYWSVDVATSEVYLSPTVREIHEMDHNVNVNEGINYYKEGYDRERIDFVVKEAIEKGTPYQEELRIITAKRKERWVRTNGRPIMEGGKCVQVIGTFIDITEEKEKEQQLKENLVEKEVLLAEVHHRVKNNLAVISGMLELQAFSSTNSNEIKELTKSVSRIRSIANIHEQLYKTGNFASIAIHDSIKIQIDKTLSMHIGDSKEQVTLLYNLENMSLNINQAIPFSLLVNELTTNALKYAFNGVPKPELKISLIKVNQDIVFSIEDNGIGFDVDEFKNSESTLGHTLIDAFVVQLKGTIDISSSSKKGSKFTITFTPADKKGSSVATNY
ncbi:MAG: PAS domain S-box protein [Balneolaceae bacterium]